MDTANTTPGGDSPRRHRTWDLFPHQREYEPPEPGQHEAGDAAHLVLEETIAAAHRILILQTRLLRELEQAGHSPGRSPDPRPASRPALEFPDGAPAPHGLQEDSLAELVELERGDLWLTGQQRRVLALIGQGMSNRRIARTLGIAENTVKNYVHAIFQKLGLQCRVEAALYAQRHGLTPHEPKHAHHPG